MTKRLSYFKFYPSDWITGKISELPYACQGVFTSIMALYWSKKCEMTAEFLFKKFPKTMINRLISEEILKQNGDKIIINFLDLQQKDNQSTSKVNSYNGSLGGRPSIYGDEKKPTAFPDKTNIEYNNSNKENIYKTNIKELFRNSFFDDFPNSSHLETVAIDLCASKETLLAAMPSFRDVASTEYTSMKEFADHFKRWFVKVYSKRDTISAAVVKTSLTFGSKNRP